MRTTQYIGLTTKAEEFVSTLQPLDSDSSTTGMFNEKIELRKWSYKTPHRMCIIREKLQVSPWSSGPMLFTCLEIDYQNGAKSECFQWIRNPTLDCEFDYTKGEFWI